VSHRFEFISCANDKAKSLTNCHSSTITTAASGKTNVCYMRAIKTTKVGQAAPRSNSTCCVTSRHDKRVMTWRDVSCVMRSACSNMADDEEAVVLACKTISCFIIIYYFSSQMKLIRLRKKNCGDHNFIHITNNKLSCVSRLSRSSRRAVSGLLCSMRDTARATFSVPKCMG